MKTKHTFLFTLILGLGWAGILFAYSTGPDPAMNGVLGSAVTCNVAGCHSGNAINATGGSVNITGLPAAWTPGQVYPLTVTVQRTSARVYGFQVSAVANAAIQQAGTLTRGSGQTTVCSNSTGSPVGCTAAGAIQFVEHLFPNTTGVFNLNWTAPSSASFGTVRFNVAGNAANQDNSNTGDFIYTKVVTVEPAAAPPPVDNSVKAYTFVNRGGVSVITDGGGATTEVGYTRIQPAAGNTAPSGVAIFGSRTNNVLVSETGVPATPALTQGRIYAEIGGAVNTGLAIANPNSATATITFFYTNAAGADLAASAMTIDPNGQITKFLDQAPFNTFGAGPFQGTFSFSSTVPVGIVALRSYTNEHGEFLMSTLPVIDTSAAPSSGTQVLPHFADGAGWVTQILLVNPTSTAMSGNVQFFNDSGTAVSVSIGGQTSSSFAYSVSSNGSQKLSTAGPANFTGGSVRVVPTGGGPAPTPLIVFSYKPLGIVSSEAGVPIASGTAFRMYVESSGTSGLSGNIQSGIAVANNTAVAASVTYELTNLDGSTTGLPPAVTATLGGNAHVGQFLAQIFPTLGNSFRGVLRISAASGSISVVGLRARYNEKTSAENFLITTTPPTLETGTPTSAELLFPDLANGGGYTTQFILFSGTTGQASSGNMRFVTPLGAPFSLTVN